MSNIKWILIIITIFLVILLFRYIQLKKQIRNLADQVNELNSGNSQQMLDILFKFTVNLSHKLVCC